MTVPVTSGDNFRPDRDTSRAAMCYIAAMNASLP